MELRHLRHFVAVAEERSFTRAAIRLHLVQSALSVSIRSLERTLETPLFKRTTHSVELTDAGAVLLPEARRTLAAAEAALDAVASVRGGLRGSVRIGIMHSLGLIDLAGLLTDFHRHWPDVRLIPRPAQGGSAELVADVVSGRLDVAFAGLPADQYPTSLVSRPLASEDMVLVEPAGDRHGRGPVALMELDRRAFVDLPVGWGPRSVVDELFAKHGLRREVSVEVGDIPNIIDLVRAGFGLALLPPSTILHRRGVILRKVTPAALFTVSLITSATVGPSAATSAFVELVSDRYEAQRR